MFIFVFAREHRWIYDFCLMVVRVKQKPGCICPGHGIYYVLLSCSLQSPDLDNTLLLSSKHGQQYQCVLPQLENLEKKNEENQHITKDEVPQLLEPMKKKCLYNVSLNLCLV